tara:strand:- start:149 stop:316 length:168 start_codon:yes stop_codon:yes gene_type:complete
VTYENPDHTGTYGVGGPETDIMCWGLNPNVGVFFNAGFLEDIGLSAKKQDLDCRR